MEALVVEQVGNMPVARSWPNPVAGPAQVAIEVSAAPIVPLDILCASGTSYFGRPPTPYVPGCHGVGRLRDGTRVWFTTAAGREPGDGSMATVAVTGATSIMKLEHPVEDAHVAALGLSAVAAYGALRRGGFEEGCNVMVLGARGTVGRCAGQLARAWGAGHITAVTRQGGDSLSWADIVIEAASDVDVSAIHDVPAADLVIDPVWGAQAAAALTALRPGGCLINLGDSAGPDSPLSSSVLRGRSISVRGYTNLSLTAEEQVGALNTILDLVGQGALKVPYRSISLHEAPDAWRSVSAGEARVRHVITFP